MTLEGFSNHNKKNRENVVYSAVQQALGIAPFIHSIARDPGNTVVAFTTEASITNDRQLDLKSKLVLLPNAHLKNRQASAVREGVEDGSGTPKSLRV